MQKWGGLSVNPRANLILQHVKIELKLWTRGNLIPPRLGWHAARRGEGHLAFSRCTPANRGGQSPSIANTEKRDRFAFTRARKGAVRLRITHSYG